MAQLSNVISQMQGAPRIKVDVSQDDVLKSTTSIAQDIAALADDLDTLREQVAALGERVEAANTAISAIPTEIPEVVVPDHRGELKSLLEAQNGLKQALEGIHIPETDLSPIMAALSVKPEKVEVEVESTPKNWTFNVIRDNYGYIDRVEVTGDR